MDETRYVRDVHGHIYIYVSYYEDRIGNGLEFVESPQSPTPSIPAPSAALTEAVDDDFKWLGVFDNASGQRSPVNRS